MNSIPATTIIKAITELLSEAYAGPKEASSTWFIDNEPNSGIFGLLESVTAEEATMRVDGSDEPGALIAGNVEHLRWSLEQINTVMRGEPWEAKWEESWEWLDLDAAGWDLLREALRSEYEVLRQALMKQEDLAEQYLIGGIAMIAHAAYHLGTIRQLIARVRQ